MGVHGGARGCTGVHGGAVGGGPYLLLGDANVLLLQRHGPVGVVEVVEALVGLDAQEGGEVLVVGQRGRERPTTRIISCVVSIWRTVRATMLSSTGPR